MRFFRRIIRITATDSPNVRLALKQIAEGTPVTGETLVPGVLPYADYAFRNEYWTEERKCVSLWAQWYEGAEVLMFPPLWLQRAKDIARSLRGKRRVARAIGIDPAEGGDKTAMSAVDEFGLIEMVSKRTPNTALIKQDARAFALKHGVPAEMVVFDRGGGGYEHACELRELGFRVTTVGFGEGVNLEPRRGLRLFSEKVEHQEEHYAYRNRRAQMYGELRLALDPSAPGFGIPEEYVELFAQLGPIPLLHDNEGRLRMLPKSKKDRESDEKTLTDLIGHSPDEADSLVLALHRMLHIQRPKMIGRPRSK